MSCNNKPQRLLWWSFTDCVALFDNVFAQLISLAVVVWILSREHSVITCHQTFPVFPWIKLAVSPLLFTQLAHQQAKTMAEEVSQQLGLLLFSILPTMFIHLFSFRQQQLCILVKRAMTPLEMAPRQSR